MRTGSYRCTPLITRFSARHRSSSVQNNIEALLTPYLALSNAYPPIGGRVLTRPMQFLIRDQWNQTESYENQ